jgi:hypothetical protein
MPDLTLVAAFKDTSRAIRLAEEVGGTLYLDERESADHLPFSSLVSGVTDDLQAFTEKAEIGAYLVHQNVIKPRRNKELLAGRLPGVIGLFTLVARADLGHQRAIEHWRDSHAPLALKVHKAMSHYSQLNILHRFNGPGWDGFALCGFDSMEDLRERFYDSTAGEKLIANDIARFADTKKSPRRIIAVEITFGKL